MAWVLLHANIPHVYGIGKFIGHFIIGNVAFEYLIQSIDIQKVGRFCTGLCNLLLECVQYDKRIAGYWNAFNMIKELQDTAP